jgi:hypothetical protein
MRPARRWKAAAALFVGSLLGALATAPAAHASSLLSCAGTETLTFQPSLTNTPTLTHIHFDIDLDLCLLGGVSTGDSQGDFQITTNCTILDVLPPAFSDTYTWNTRASSTATYTAPVETVVNGSLVVTDTGTVTSGLDEGALANETTTLPEPNLIACATTGVAALNGPYALTFS